MSSRIVSSAKKRPNICNISFDESKISASDGCYGAPKRFQSKYPFQLVELAKKTKSPSIHPRKIYFKRKLNTNLQPSMKILGSAQSQMQTSPIHISTVFPSGLPTFITEDNTSAINAKYKTTAAAADLRKSMFFVTEEKYSQPRPRVFLKGYTTTVQGHPRKLRITKEDLKRFYTRRDNAANQKFLAPMRNSPVSVFNLTLRVHPESELSSDTFHFQRRTPTFYKFWKNGSHRKGTDSLTEGSHVFGKSIKTRPLTVTETGYEDAYKSFEGMAPSSLMNRKIPQKVVVNLSSVQQCLVSPQRSPTGKATANLKDGLPYYYE